MVTAGVIIEDGVGLKWALVLEFWFYTEHILQNIPQFRGFLKLTKKATITFVLPIGITA